MPTTTTTLQISRTIKVFKDRFLSEKIEIPANTRLEFSEKDSVFHDTSEGTIYKITVLTNPKKVIFMTKGDWNDAEVKGTVIQGGGRKRTRRNKSRKNKSRMNRRRTYRR